MYLHFTGVIECRFKPHHDQLQHIFCFIYILFSHDLGPVVFIGAKICLQKWGESSFKSGASCLLKWGELSSNVGRVVF